MNKVSIIRAIVKAYFVGALVISFIHIVTAAGKTGLSGYEMWVTPLMIDGIAIIGMIMRGPEFSQRTRKIGFRTQIGAGLISLIANVYAADSVGGMILGVAVVALFLFSEWLSDNITTAEDDKRAERNAKARTRRAATKTPSRTRKPATRKLRAV